ncbi:hypothetical protein ACI3KS_16515 [Microbacterium sp. ZW T5_45]|uniref:hypothetical protein n=1 Tax=Microbacterium sp. ZW T5_45 TaxID=3378080 RepID=UPI0038527B0C
MNDTPDKPQQDPEVPAAPGPVPPGDWSAAPAPVDPTAPQTPPVDLNAYPAPGEQQGETHDAPHTYEAPAPYQAPPAYEAPAPYEAPPAYQAPAPYEAPAPYQAPAPYGAPAAHEPPQDPAAAYPTQAQDPNAYGQPQDPNAYGQPQDPNAYGQPVDPAAYGQPQDPNAYAQAAYPGQPQDPNGYAQPAYPGQPQDPNAYAQAAYPGQVQDPNAYPGASPADPNAAYPAYGAAPAGPKKPMSKGLLFGLIGGGVAVVLIIAAAIIIPIVTRGPEAGPGGGGTAPAASSPSEFVEGYLTALSEGDAEAALEYVDSNYGEDLLTDDVLAASLELNPIGDIEIGEKESENDYGDTIVDASFTIGDTTIERTFQVYEAYGDEGDYEIVDGLVSFSAPYGFEGLDLTVNGAAAPAEYTSVFPGTYAFAVGIDAFAIDGESTFILGNDGDGDDLYSVKPVLSEAGTAKFRELVSASFNECLASKSLSTPCGMDVSAMSQDGYTPIDGTITRTIDAEAQAKIANLAPTVSERAIVTTYDYWSVDITLDGTNGSSTSQFEVLFGASVLSPKVDFSAETPAVIWE